MDHCEFPYGFEEHWAYSDLVSLGWLLVVLELLVIIFLLARKSGARNGDVIDGIHRTVLVFSEAAAKAELANVYKARDDLLRVIRQILGEKGVLGADLAAQVAKLNAVGTARKPPTSKPHVEPSAHPASVTASATSGPQVTVYIQGDAGHGGHGHHGNGEIKPEPSLDERLWEIRTAAGVFADYWRDKPSRVAELRAVRDSLTQRSTLGPNLEKLRA